MKCLKGAIILIQSGPGSNDNKKGDSTEYSLMSYPLF